MTTERKRKTRGSRAAPLSPRARDLAARHLGFALWCAGPWARSYPDLRDDFASAAHLGLVHAVRGWDPARGAMATIIKETVWSECNMALRKSRRAKRRATRPGRGPGLDRLPARQGPGPDDGELLAPLLASLRPRNAAMVAAVVIDGRSATEVAREHGCTKQNVSWVVRDSLARLRQHPSVRAIAV